MQIQNTSNSYHYTNTSGGSDLPLEWNDIIKNAQGAMQWQEPVEEVEPEAEEKMCNKCEKMTSNWEDDDYICRECRYG